MTIGTVAVEQQRRRAVERGRSPMEERDGHLGAVMAHGGQPAGDVVGGIVPARHLLGLAQRPGTGAHVVVEGLPRRRHRAVDGAERLGLEFVAGREREVVGLLLEGDGVRLAALQVGHDNARQAAHPLQPHMMAGEEELGAHIGAGLVGEPVTPPLSPLRLHRRGDDLEIGRGIGVGQDVEQFAVVREVVFDTALASSDEAGRALGRRGLDQTNLGGRMVVRRYHDEAPALSLVDVDEETGVGLLVDHRVRARSHPPGGGAPGRGAGSRRSWCRIRSRRRQPRRHRHGHPRWARR